MKKHRDDMPVMMKDDGLELLSDEFGDMVVSHFTLPAGFDFSPIFQALPKGQCPCDHWGRVVEGDLHLRYEDGTEEVTRAGEFYHWPAGHTAWTETGVVFIDLVPVEQARYVNEQLGL